MTRLDDGAAVTVLLDAARRLIDADQTIQLVIAGSGLGGESARRLAREANLSGRVTVTSVPGDFEPLLTAMDVFVHARTEDWHGTELMQALAAGRPAVACGVGAVFSLIREGETGHIVRRGDAAGMAEAVGRLLADDVRRGVMGRAAREAMAAKFATEIALDRLLGVYSEAIESSRR
jgi:phosphatidylinositol alpha-mannosyltransferase